MVGGGTPQSTGGQEDNTEMETRDMSTVRESEIALVLPPDTHSSSHPDAETQRGADSV